LALTKETKNEVIEKWSRHEGDTGSPEVQIALLTARINALTAHIQESRKDVHSRRGLLQMHAKRRRLLRYLSRHDRNSYQNVVESHGMRDIFDVIRRD